MKLMTKYFLTFALSLFAVLSANAATPGTHQSLDSKLSISTRMFLEELQGDLDFNTPTPSRLNSPGLPQLLQPVERPYVAPDTIDGVAYISAFVRVTADEAVRDMESLGTIVETRFKDGLLTALIPVARIHDVAALQGVKKIEVSPVMRLATDEARKATNVDDVLTWSAAALNAGLPKRYDGRGVILGVIDRGIDYDHIAFKDKDGNCRIKRAYVFNGKGIDYYGTGQLPNDGVTNTDHGSHTSAIAGGSSVIVNGTDITVTDDHGSATYGGMAPGAELFLCGINGMGAAQIANAFHKICAYADSVGKPLVVSNSYGDYVYNRDGGGTQAEVIAQLFGEDHPGRICVFATGNNAGHSGGEPGGVYVSGSATSEAPLGTIVSSSPEVHDAGWVYYRGEYIADAFTRATDATGIGVNIVVLDKVTGEVVHIYDHSSASGNVRLQLDDYFTGYGGDGRAQVRIYYDYMTANNRKQALVYAPYGLMSPDYTLAVEVYPIGGSSDVIDMWSCGTFTFFDNHLTTEGHTWTLGSDDMSVMANACYPQVISVGSYVSRTREDSNQVGDISNFSCYALEGMGPLGTMHPWITAPGEDIISAFNHNVNHGDDYDEMVINNPLYPYGRMSGTSMCTPTVAGIVALWMQAAAECGKQFTLSEVKEIMKETAIRDSWVTSGPNASHFGNGKIDALAGIEYILDNYHDFTVGDVDHDGAINISDVTTLIGYLLNNDKPACPICSDVDADGHVNISDVTTLIGILLQSH
ncbi:MAG: S8 family serine peptidase [Muribaculaceae bacterium]|nr:S8 family serine peptidase [Muribaculaceae bacterium]